jgi:hypothetical protein
MTLTRKQELLDIAVIDRFAEQQEEYPTPYYADDGWLFILKGVRLSGDTPRLARHALAEALRKRNP